MRFPTARDCLRIRGAERDILHDFDRRLREAILRTGLEASNRDVDDNEFGKACVTVMMTVAADLALASSESPAEIDAGHFANAATDALAWAGSRLAGRQKSGKSRGLLTPQSLIFRRAFRKSKDRLQ